jgi:DNA-binding response OmpR family regulator
MSKTILVIDDEPDLLQAVCGFLEDEGFDVRAASSGSEGLDVLRTGSPPDLVLLDVMMPGLSGYEVLERMSAIESVKRVPVIMMSAVDPSVTAHGPRGRWRAFLRKPFGIDDLLATIARCA